MRVKCLKNNIYDFKYEKQLFKYLKDRIHLDEGILPITLNQEYNVYALNFDEEFIEFLICDDEYSFLEYPLFYLSNFFEIIDNRVSKCWENMNSNNFNKNDKFTNKIISFKEWDQSNHFYEHLIDGSDVEIKLFSKYKIEMDKEF